MELNMSKEQELSCQVSSNSLLLNYIIVFFFQRVENRQPPRLLKDLCELRDLQLSGVYYHP